MTGLGACPALDAVVKPDNDNNDFMTVFEQQGRSTE